MRIGIVENDSDFRDNLLLTLKKILPTAQIDWWQSAEGLLRDIQGATPDADVLLLDIMLPGMTGVDLTRELKSIIETVVSGGAILTPTIALRVMTTLKARRWESPDFGLSQRLQQVLELMVAGKTVVQVAKVLRLSPATVHGYVKDIYKKLNVHNRVELVDRVRKFG